VTKGYPGIAPQQHLSCDTRSLALTALCRRSYPPMPVVLGVSEIMTGRVESVDVPLANRNGDRIRTGEESSASPDPVSRTDPAACRLDVAPSAGRRAPSSPAG
jgi:hypothetical protein